MCEVNWIDGEAPNGPVRARVKVRHRHAGVWSEVTPLPGGMASIRFEEPVRAVSPGQAAVFSDEPEPGVERILGGGWIVDRVG